MRTPTKRKSGARLKTHRPRVPMTDAEMFHFADHRWPRPNHPVGVGELVARFAVPLVCAPLVNVYSRMHHMKRKRIHEQCFTLMYAQNRGYARAPLSGRPRVLATRFSSVQPDAHAAWSKVPVDRLLVCPPQHRTRKLGLGFLVDDDPTHLDLHTWWEPASPGKGFVYLELWTNDPSGE